jgi:Mn2+/Fe2+ NRAMP family transporter
MPHALFLHSDVTKVECSQRQRLNAPFSLGANRFRDIDFGRGHNGRPDDYAGLHWLSYPALGEKVVTMVSSFVVVGLGVNATNALVISQVVLSLACRFR